MKESSIFSTHVINSIKTAAVPFTTTIFYNKVRTDSVFHFDDGDVVVPNFWKIKNDTLIDIRGIKYSLIKYSEDSVFLKNLINRDTLILAKNCRTFHNKSHQ